MHGVSQSISAGIFVNESIRQGTKRNRKLKRNMFNEVNLKEIQFVGG